MVSASVMMGTQVWIARLFVMRLVENVQALETHNAFLAIVEES
jgi:hypothetical protein